MTPDSGVPLDVATRRAAIVSGLRYDLSLSIPEALASPLTGTMTIRFDLKDASAPLVLDFETSREHVKSVDANGKPVAINYVNGHIVIPAASLAAGANTIRIAFDAGDASLNRSNDFLYTLVRAGAGAAGVSGVRSTRPQGPLDADARASGEMAIGGERRRAVAHDERAIASTVKFARDRAAADLSRRVHRRRLQDRDRGAQRPHVPDVPSRNRRRQGGAQPRRDFRSARARARVPRALHRDPVPVRQVRLRRDPGVPVRRHGARRQDSLQRVGPDARRIGDAEPAARPRLGDLRTRPRTCGSAIWSRCAGSTTCG